MDRLNFKSVKAIHACHQYKRPHFLCAACGHIVHVELPIHTVQYARHIKTINRFWDFFLFV